MKKTAILVVESEAEVAESIKARLETRGDFNVDVVSTGYGALQTIRTFVPDALLLDAVLPDLPGLELCRLVRSRDKTAHVPVIMLDGGSNGVGAVASLERGADDYLTKPLELEELEARVKAVLRRRNLVRLPEVDRFDGVRLQADFTNVSVTVDNAAVALTKREFLLLRFLVHNRNRVIDRENLLANAWGSKGESCRIVDSAIYKLRTKLRSAGEQIETVAGFGYRFNEPSPHRSSRKEG